MFVVEVRTKERTINTNLLQRYINIHLKKYPHMYIFCAYLLHFRQTNETAAAIGLPEKK